MSLPLGPGSPELEKFAVAMKLIETATELLDVGVELNRRIARGYAWYTFLKKLGLLKEEFPPLSEWDEDVLRRLAEKLIERARALAGDVFKM